MARTKKVKPVLAKIDGAAAVELRHAFYGWWNTVRKEIERGRSLFVHTGPLADAFTPEEREKGGRALSRALDELADDCPLPSGITTRDLDVLWSKHLHAVYPRKKRPAKKK